MSTGTCGVCAGELGEDALKLDLTVSPGTRGGSMTAVLPTTVTGFWLCGPCRTGDGGLVLRAMIASPWMQAVPKRPKRCTVMCIQPKRRWWKSLGARERIGDARCPECFGPAYVEVAENTEVPRGSILHRVIGLTETRPRWTE